MDYNPFEDASEYFQRVAQERSDRIAQLETTIDRLLAWDLTADRSAHSWMELQDLLEDMRQVRHR